MDTEKIVGGAPAQIVFCLSPYFTNSVFPSLLLERGAHRPSLVGPLAPFHPDPSQQIVVLCFPYAALSLVIRVGALLKFLGSHEGSEVGWDEWKNHVVIPTAIGHPWEYFWVSGCRFFSLYQSDSGSDAEMEVHNFSMQGCANHPSRQVMEGLDGVRCQPSTRVRTQMPLGHVHHARTWVKYFPCSNTWTGMPTHFPSSTGKAKR